MPSDPEELIARPKREVERLEADIAGRPARLHGVALACPRDRAALLEYGGGRSVHCRTCKRFYFEYGAVWDFRVPDALTEAEDFVHAERGSATWHRFALEKAERIRDFEDRWLPMFTERVDGPMRFLELGAGLSYASVLVKLASPEAVVVTTDVSLRYLQNHAAAVATFMGTWPNFWAAADVRHLPFADGQFDRVWSAMLLYRLPDPAEAIAEIRRVLAPGGRWLGLEPAAPWAWPWAGREYARMARLNRERGTRETPRSMRFWRGFARREGLRLGVPPGSRVPWPWARWAVNAVRGVHVWLDLEAPP